MPRTQTAGDLVIVEPPAKGKTIERCLGHGYHMARFGHVREVGRSGGHLVDVAS